MIAQHIEYYLLQHSSITVAGLGLFTLHREGAMWSEETHRITPPQTLLRFHPESGREDELVHSLMQRFHITRERAEAYIQEEVKRIHAALEETDASFSLGNLGVFTKMQGVLCFTPNISTVTPISEAWGLGEIDLQPLKRVSLFPHTEERKEKVAVSKRPRRISTAWLRVPIAAAIALLMLLVAIPLEQPDVELNYATLFPLEITTETPEPIRVAPLQEPEVEQPLEEVEIVEEKPSTTLVKSDTCPSYIVVIASLATSQQAELEAARIQAELPTSNIRCHKQGSRTRLYIAGFDTSREAYAYIQEQQDGDAFPFPDAWVLATK